MTLIAQILPFLILPVEDTIYITSIMHPLSFLDPFPAFNNNLDNSLKYILI